MLSLLESVSHALAQLSFAEGGCTSMELPDHPGFSVGIHYARWGKAQVNLVVTVYGPRTELGSETLSRVIRDQVIALFLEGKPVASCKIGFNRAIVPEPGEGPMAYTTFRLDMGEGWTMSPGVDRRQEPTHRGYTVRLQVLESDTLSSRLGKPVPLKT